MNELENLLYTEKFRPQTLKDIILKDKEVIYNVLKKKKEIPSFIFYSNSPGSGKTSLARVIVNELRCDNLELNASDERGINVVREKIKTFATSLSNNSEKRCIFLDEAEQLTQEAQKSLKFLMEEYSNNCFFILTTNSINKIISPLQSRCTVVNFNQPPISDIEVKLLDICDKEEIDLGGDIKLFIKKYYPDIRTMVKKLQEIKLGLNPKEENYPNILLSVESGDYNLLKQIVYSGELDILEFNKWLFEYVFDNYEKYGLDRASKIANLLADTEKSANIGISLEVVFLANILEVSKLI